MSTLRKSERLRKPITTIDQNLEGDDEEHSQDDFIETKPRKTVTPRTSVKRPSTDDNDEQDMITPKKRQRKKPSTTATKTSPYFESKTTEKKANPPKAKKPTKPKGKKNDASFDENTTMSMDTASVTTKTTTASDSDDDDSDDDDEDDWEHVQTKPSEEVVIQKLLKEREERQPNVVNGEVEISLTSEEVAAAQGKRKKNLNSKEHQLELHLKRVLKQNFLQKHKDNIVCNLGHGFQLIKTYVHNEEMCSLMLSLLDESVTKTLVYKAKSTNMNDIHRLVKYFDEVFFVTEKSTKDESDAQAVTMAKLRQALSEHCTKPSSPIRVILFAIYVRILHYECRLVFAADLPAIRPRAEKQEKLRIPHGSLTRNIKKKMQTLSDDDNSNSISSEDASRLHSHDHSSDLSRVVASSSSQSVKDHRAISPPAATTVTAAKPKIQSRRLLPRYYWIELFIETTDDGYIPIDLYTSKINAVTDFEENIQFPMLYVWAFDTDLSSSYAKDVTKRYSQKWLTTPYRTSHIDHKTNGDPKWYDKLMKKYQPKDKKKSRYSQHENKQIENQLAKQPIPQSKSELVGHPLYVLKSKLLKFEGIYPNDTPPVGWLKEEPIYARENIHILRSKQTWLKEARQVNYGEEPYKIVDGRIKNMDRKMGVTTRPELELFGEWQTADFVPPVAKDGIVPCNEYGNVDLFKPEMLPVGCVHIVEPNAARLCKKLGINYAEAITGFDAHGGGSHPVMEGIVVCQEFEQTLREAVEQQKQIMIEKEIKKKEERIYKNWRKLIRGLIIKQNLARKYADDETEGGELATDAKYQWPVLPKEDKVNEEEFM